VLSQIAAKKKARIAEAKIKVPLAAIKERLPDAEAPRPFNEALLIPGISVIAEVKKASPSKGDFNLMFPVDELAQHYEKGGARAISVLTEEDFFRGSAADLIQVRRVVRLPVLRKDFIIDSYQLYESRIMGADAVLLITGLLEEKEVTAFLDLCNELGLAALVETHSEVEIKTALRAGAKIVGINNRNLQTFTTDVSHTIQLASLVPDELLLISESGIHTARDVDLLAAAGVDAMLVGESLICHCDPAKKIQELVREGAP